MLDSRENRSYGLGKAVGKGVYSQVAVPTPSLRKRVGEDPSLLVDIVVAPLVVGSGLAFLALYKPTELVVNGARAAGTRLAELVFDRECFDIDAGKYVDAPGGQIDDSQRL